MTTSSRLTFSSAAARAAMDTNLAGVEGEEDLDEEPGEEIESAPPLRVGEEREINGGSGLRKKLLRTGRGWETPVHGDEVTVHYVGSLLDGLQFDSTRDRGGEPLTFKVGHGPVVAGLDHGIVTMKKGEFALFTVPSALGYGDAGAYGVPPGADLRFEVELISWLSVLDVCKDGGIVKKILRRGEGGQPGDLDEVAVKYQVKLPDGLVAAETPEGGVEFYVNDGHLCPALPKVLKSMEKGEKAAVTVQPQYAFGEQGRDVENGFSPIPPNSMLNIDLELLFFKPVVDVTGDMKVLKKVLKAGEGIRVPKEGESVSIRYTAKLENGTVFEKLGLDGEAAFQYIVDEEQVIAGLDQAVATMAKGEVSLLTVKPEYGYGNNEVNHDLATVPACSTLIYEVEMVDFIKEKESWELNNQEKIEAAGKVKESGNTLFKIGKYQRAARKYDKAVEYVNDEQFLENDEQKLVKALRVSCWLNGAACNLKLNDFLGAIRLCSKVLDIEFHNVKALFRRAQAYIETADLDLAELDLKKALEVDPQNREVKLLQKKLKQIQTESNKKNAKMYTNMFALMRKETDVAMKRLKVEKAHDEGEDTEVQAMDSETTMVGATSHPSADEMVVDSSGG